MAQIQLDNHSGSTHEETSQDSLTEVDESRPPNPSLILSPQKAMETRATDPSVNLSSPRAPECLSPAQDNEQPSLSLSELECEELEDEEEDSIPQHEFDVRITQGKFGKMKLPERRFH